MTKPSAPPEAALIRLVRQAARMTTAAAARRAGISRARWNQVELGYERRDGADQPVSGSAQMIAAMAIAVGASPERLEQAGRADAAEIAREMLRQAGEDDGPPSPACWYENRIMASDVIGPETKKAMIAAHRAEGHVAECRPGYSASA